MKFINLKLCGGDSRVDYLEAMPQLRQYVLAQSVELAQTKAKHTVASLTAELPEIDTEVETATCIVGCIDTEKPPYKKFWEQAKNTLSSHHELSERIARHRPNEEELTVNSLAIVASAIRAYLTGYRIYDAARYAHRKPIKQSRLSAYWDQVKV